jgi:hypothetical protein
MKKSSNYKSVLILLQNMKKIIKGGQHSLDVSPNTPTQDHLLARSPAEHQTGQAKKLDSIIKQETTEVPLNYRKLFSNK